MASESKDDAPIVPRSADAATAPSPVTSGARNPRGIPGALFVEDIEAFLKEYSLTAEQTVEELNTLHSKYKFMESQLLDNRSRLKSKIPDISASLDAVVMLQKHKAESKPVVTHYNLAEQVYVPATIPPGGDKVCLWLGANVMLEYTYDEAEALLRGQLEAANAKLAGNGEDLAYIREQIITTEVNMARIYNHDVKVRRARAAAEAGVSLGSTATTATAAPAAAAVPAATA